VDAFAGGAESKKKKASESSPKANSTPESEEVAEASAELVAEVNANKESSKRKGLLRNLKGFWD